MTETDPIDPKGLIRESFRMPGLTEPECRSIFLDWALTAPGGDLKVLIGTLLARYGADWPDHPMAKVLRAGLDTPPQAKRRGGRAARVPQG